MTNNAAMTPDISEVHTLIIGAGFGGLLTAIKLKEAGIDDFVILDKDEGVGGTWWANSYPGCACDVQSHLYSYSFEPNPDWSHMFGRQSEIRDYMRHCVAKYGLEQHIRLRCEVRRARYRDSDGRWQVEAKDGTRYRSRFLVAATGGLSRPAHPDIPGLEEFKGEIFHSAAWNHDYDLKGKRVAAIGTGASAIQFVPAIAADVDQLFVYQRTPPWILPRPDRAITGFEKKMFRRFPITQKIYRTILYWRLESRALVFTVFPGLSRMIEWLGRRHIRKSIPDPHLRMQVVPDYPAGCKRILLSDDYYPALTRDNVYLVTRRIREITADGVVTTDGAKHEVDAIILGTGFQATKPLPEGMIIGRQGLDITQRWQEGLEAYKGISVSGFPNLFVLAGPNTGLGHNSVIFMLEAEVHYVMDCIKTMQENGVDALEIRRDVEAEYNRRLQRRLARTIWASGCRSWYLDENGKNTTLWPGFTVEYWSRTRKFDIRNYVSLTAGNQATPGDAAEAA
ncbi:MAG: NAD(P)/FAD-dependent oxidoreductase [Gammaproteobacteria bacterium]|nr:MAG: NAD(P)/FAD-dependent oxidoreductase [Gammaproteobacteria bacterium]